MNSACAFLLEYGSPILRWRTACELLAGDAEIDRTALLTELLECAEVRRWLALLGTGPVHHSKDSAAENVLAKLCEYGLHAGLPELNDRALPYCALGPGERYHDEALILAPFLARAGYAGDPRVAAWLSQRIDVLYALASSRNYDFYMDEAERQCLPSSQQVLHGMPKLFYKQRFNHYWGILGLPTCYDLYALAYMPKGDVLERRKIETIVEYLLDPIFQETSGGYIWDSALRRPYAAGRVFLACLPRQDEVEKLVLFLEMLAQFKCGKTCTWVDQMMNHLETFRTPRGTYCFPGKYLNEKTSYYLYAGMHMGLGEAPRNLRTLELESTFRMERIKKIITS